jgi:hypothetical protein
MVIPLRVQCSKDFVCNRRQHSSRSQRASLSLGIRFEADNVIVLRGESPQSSLGRACRLQLIFIWCLGNEGQGVVKVRQHTNAYKQHHGANGILIKSKGTVTVVWVPTSVALRGVSRSTGDETRQPADFNRVASQRLCFSLSASLFRRVLAQSPWVRSARVLSAVGIVWVLFRPWETRRAILVGSRELCGR